jgi:tetratricopeptide (TPR) repeat protein
VFEAVRIALRPPRVKLHDSASVATLASMASRLLAFLIVALASVSAAQPRNGRPDEAQTAAARALFGEGVQLAHAGDHAAAADRFERALELRWAPPIAHNLAEALAQLGRYVEAIEHLRSVERSAEATDDVKATAAERRLELEPMVGRLRVTLAPDEPGLEIRVDGRALPAALRGMAFPVDPGGRVVTVHRGAQEAGRTNATVVAATETNVYVEVAPQLPTPEELAAEEERRRALEEAERARLDAEQARVEAERAEAARTTRRRRLGGGLGAAGAVVVGAIVLGIALALRPEADPRLDGNFDPPRLQGRVEGVMP